MDTRYETKVEVKGRNQPASHFHQQTWGFEQQQFDSENGVQPAADKTRSSHMNSYQNGLRCNWCE